MTCANSVSSHPFRRPSSLPHHQTPLPDNIIHYHPFPLPPPPPPLLLLFSTPRASRRPPIVVPLLLRLRRLLFPRPFPPPPPSSSQPEARQAPTLVLALVSRGPTQRALRQPRPFLPSAPCDCCRQRNAQFELAACHLAYPESPRTRRRFRSSSLAPKLSSLGLRPAAARECECSTAASLSRQPSYTPR